MLADEFLKQQNVGVAHVGLQAEGGVGFGLLVARNEMKRDTLLGQRSLAKRAMPSLPWSRMMKFRLRLEMVGKGCPDQWPAA